MDAHGDDTLLFSHDTPPEPATDENASPRWKVLVVDDEEGVHSITEMTLARMRFANRKVSFLHAYSGEEARLVLQEHDDIAIVLLDVVMETEDAGLKVADFIRQDLDNHRTRIILRTGQPGQAPEEQVIEQYDINDYKEKTELTYRKLYSAVYTALRSYRDILALERNRIGLEKVIEATAHILEKESLEAFAEGVLDQLAALLYMDEQLLLVEYQGVFAEKQEKDFRVLARSFTQGEVAPALEPALRSRLIETLNKEQDVVEGNRCLRHISSKGPETLLFLSGNQPISDIDRHLVDLFCRNVSIALDNVRLNDTLRHTQKDIVYSLCELAESRSKETGNHVRRVAHYSLLMAQELGFDQFRCDQIFLAAPLHDVGKIGIPDAILNKPGKLDADEWEIMKRHTSIGAQVMKRSQQVVLQAGAIIAEQHHENWDGSGYPAGLAGEDIHIFGRIVALADVFDALASRRCYKEPWTLEEIDRLIHDQTGVKFDPALVAIYTKRKDDFIRILDTFSDETAGS